MVYTVTSQNPKLTEHFFRQPYLFKYFQNTTYGMDEFFSLRLKLKYMKKRKVEKIKISFNHIGDFHKPRVKIFYQKIIPREKTLGMLFFYHPDALLIKLCNISAVGCKYLVLIVFWVSPNKRATWSRSILKL